jgi:hypothetical protein
LRKEKQFIVVNIAHRKRDHVTLGEDGLDTLRLLLDLGRKEHARWLKQADKGQTNKWSENLKFRDKIIERLFSSAKKVIVEVDWNEWADIEREIEKEIRRLNK